MQLLEHDEQLDSADANSYATTKTFAQGFFDAALISANASQLVALKTSTLQDSPFGSAIEVLSILSICLNAIAFVILVVLGFKKLKPESNTRSRVDRQLRILNLVVTIIVGISLIVNIILAVFVASQSTGE